MVSSHISLRCGGLMVLSQISWRCGGLMVLSQISWQCGCLMVSSQISWRCGGLTVLSQISWRCGGLMVLSRHFQQYFSYIVAVSFIGGGNRSHWQTLSHNVVSSIEYTLPWTRFKLTTIVVIAIDCTGSSKYIYHMSTTTTALGQLAWVWWFHGL
jgi:hypothetical protein